MKKLLGGVLFVLSAILVAYGQEAFALPADKKIHVDFQGTGNVKVSTNADSDTTGFVDLTGDYTWQEGSVTKKINISCLTNCAGLVPDKLPRVEFDENAETLIMKNAKITIPSGSPVPVTDVKLTFYRKFSPPPSGTTWYEVNGAGSFTRPGTQAKDDSITLRGSVENPNATWKVIQSLSTTPPFSCTTQLTKCVTCLFAGCGNFSPTSGFKGQDNWGNLSSDHTLKVDVWFTLQQASDQLQVTATNGIQMKNIPPPGADDGGTCPPCKKCKKCKKE